MLHSLFIGSKFERLLSPFLLFKLYKCWIHHYCSGVTEQWPKYGSTVQQELFCSLGLFYIFSIFQLQFFYFFSATIAQCQTFHPFPFLLDMNPPSKPWGFTKTLKCINRMKPGARQPKAPMASLLHTTHPTIWLAASLQSENRPEEEEADVEFPVLAFWEVMDTHSLVHIAEFSRNIFKE